MRFCDAEIVADDDFAEEDDGVRGVGGWGHGFVEPEGCYGGCDFAVCGWVGEGGELGQDEGIGGFFEGGPVGLGFGVGGVEGDGETEGEGFVGWEEGGLRGPAGAVD